MNEGEVDTFIKTHFKKEIVKQREIDNEPIGKICKFFAYGI